jgi:hypothetical protein
LATPSPPFLAGIRRLEKKRRVILGVNFEDVMNLRPDQRGGGGKVGYSLKCIYRRPSRCERVREKERSVVCKRHIQSFYF